MSPVSILSYFTWKSTEKNYNDANLMKKRISTSFQVRKNSKASQNIQQSPVWNQTKFFEAFNILFFNFYKICNSYYNSLVYLYFQI